ncbi:hypothetical protein J2W33_000556 [Variovorax boronicumulans]|nr:hypothetical protein [Variovorax boronicumulans]
MQPLLHRHHKARKSPHEAGTDQSGRSGLAGKLNRAVIIAMVPVWMMKVAVNQVVDVIAMRHGFMAAVGTVNMSRLMTRAAMVRRALIGIRGGDVEGVLVNVAIVHMVQMAVMQIVDMVAVRDGGVAARRAMLMRVFAGVL